MTGDPNLEGADVNSTDVDGTSALHFATLNSNDEMVNLLIEARAKVMPICCIVKLVFVDRFFGPTWNDTAA